MCKSTTCSSTRYGYITYEDTPTDPIDVKNNDEDPEDPDNPLTLISVDQPSEGGVATPTPEEQIIYIPPPNQCDFTAVIPYTV